MSETVSRPPVATAGRHVRQPGLADLRRACQVTLIALVVQFSLGMVLNLYVQVPASDQHAGFLQEIRTAPAVLTAHALLGILLIGAAGVLMVRAIGTRDRLMIAMVATGLAAILGAFAAGEVFVRNGQSSLSLSMAILTGVALVGYIAALGRTSAALRQASYPSVPPAEARRPRPGHPPAVPLPRRVNPVSGPQRRLDYPATGPQPRAPYPAGPPGWRPAPDRRGFPPQASRAAPPRRYPPASGERS